MVKNVPRLAVGAVIYSDNKILLVKRKNPPSQGMWAIPGGKVRWGESLKQALKREIQEELHVEIEPERLLKVVELLPDENSAFHYVIMDYLVHITKGVPEADDDAAEVAWFTKNDLAQIPVTASTKDLLHEFFDF